MILNSKSTYRVFYFKGCVFSHFHYAVRVVIDRAALEALRAG